uniref:Eukaryotic translation initiation factor 2-alpha kinase 2 n=1 Tax=Stegastes partitus TaxID=144197 RepID=A0A3B4ZQP6_9TELE
MMESENYVAKLNEFAQRKRWELRYEDVGCTGPDHIKTFTLRAILNDKAYPGGVGKNKKEAKQNAAKNTLRGLLEEASDSTEQAAEASTTPGHQTSISSINYICWLNEYGQKNRLNINPVETTRLGQLNTLYYCRFVVGDKEYPTASGKTKKEAKEEAAKLVYDDKYGSSTTETVDVKNNVVSSPQTEKGSHNDDDICERTKSLSVKPEDNSIMETNFIGIINLYCQKTRSTPDYILIQRCGPSHSPQFFYKLVINNKEYPVGEGKTIKEAKQNAAQLAWCALQEQSDWDNKVTSWSPVSDDVAPSRLPTAPSPLQSLDAKSENMPTSTSDSAIVISPSNPSKDKDKNPDFKSKRKIAANFQISSRRRKEDMKISDGKEKHKEKSSSEKNSSKTVISRFMSEFDSIERIGKGAFGRVFKAKQKLLDKYFAIKIVRCKEKALREVGTLSDLHHSNIVRYYTCWMEDSEYQWDSTGDSCSTSLSSSDSSAKYLYIQMELCDTRTLRVWIDERNTQNAKKSLRDFKRREESLAIAQQIVSGVEYFHSKRLIHRDLKPANIMFGQDGEVKIGDFGLVTTETDDDAENLMERTEYKGTPSYMAPEQKSRSTYDRKVDIFALGLIYFELLWNLPAGPDRKAIWEDARNQKLPHGFLPNFPQEVHRYFFRFYSTLNSISFRLAFALILHNMEDVRLRYKRCSNSYSSKC